MAAEETDFQLQNSHHAIEFGRECVRSGILINGGAAVALIGFLGGKGITSPDAIKQSLLAFSAGVVLAFLAGIAGYFAQTAFAEHNLRRAEGKDSSDRKAVVISIVGVALVTFSIISFCYGVYGAGKALFPS